MAKVKIDPLDHADRQSAARESSTVGDYLLVRAVSPYVTFGPTLLPRSPQPPPHMKLLAELTNVRIPTARQIRNEILAQRRVRREALARERRRRGLNVL